MSNQEQHLSLEQIDCLIETQLGAAGIPAQSGLPQEARRHLETCEACQRLVSKHSECDRMLRDSKNDARPRENCPSDKSLYQLAAGIVEADEAGGILDHTVQCGRCSSVLRQASEEVGLDNTADEKAAFASLRSSTPEWQKDLASKLAAMNTPLLDKSAAVHPPRIRAPFPFQANVRWVYARFAAAAVLVGLIGFWSYHEFKTPSLDHLLAQAYTEHRTVELRITGASYSNFVQQRGVEASSLAKPPELLRAEYEIREQLAARPEDAAVWSAKGRAELLELQYDPAIASLKHAIDLKADSADLLCDLATAYAERANAENRPLDYGEAIEYLGQALSKRPDDPVALFNRAIVEDKLTLFEEASKDWEHYLRVDPQGDWAAEARQHLEEIRRKLNQSSSIPPAESDPARAAPLIEARARGQTIEPAGWPVSRDEEYLEVAVTNWLPSLVHHPLVPGAGAIEPAEWRALKALSRVLATQHGDL